MGICAYLGRGIAHERKGIPCQDALNYCTADNGNVIAAMSDGAGSAKYAMEAAWENVAGVLDYFSQIPLSVFLAMEKRECILAVLNVCRARILRLQKITGEDDLRLFSATLLFAVNDGTHMVLGHLGDGLLAVLGEDGAVIVNSLPQRQGKGTYFVTSVQAADKMQLITLPSDSASFTVMTSDGIWETMCTYGKKDLISALRMLQHEVTGGTHADLERAMNSMVQTAHQRMDDWSLLTLDLFDLQNQNPPPDHASSMLEEEMRKLPS